MNYRCPTCTTKYRASDKDEARDYIRCQVCGFLIDVAANRIRDGGDRARPAPTEQVRRWPFFVAVLLVLLGLAWVMAAALRSGVL